MKNWLDMTLEEAAEKIAEIAADRRSRPATWAEKQAEGGGLLSGLGSAFQQNPMLASTLLGGAAGAGISGIGTAMGNSRKDPTDRRSVLHSMLAGGLGGAAVGGGLSMAGQAIGGLSGGPTPGGMPRGQFTDPSSGRQMQIDPAMLRQHPELAARARELSAPAPAHQQLGMSALGNLWNTARSAVGLDAIPGTQYGDGNIGSSFAPISSHILPKIGLIDALAHAPGVNLGERLGFGRVRPQFSTDPAHLQAGAEAAKDLPPAIRSALLENKPHQGPMPGVVSNTSSPSHVEVPGAPVGMGAANAIAGQQPLPRGGGSNPVTRFINKYLRGPENPNASVLNVRSAPPETVEMHVPHDAQDPTAGFDKVKSERPNIDRTKVESLNRQTQRGLTQRGYQAAEAAEHGGTPRGLFMAGGKTRPMMGRLGGTLARAGIYGGLPLLEYAARSGLDNVNREQQLRDMMQRFARPVPGQPGQGGQ